ncbi:MULTISPECIES: hypothetical protein [unclassified Frankia]|uniref:hypothetical protein n=1 Tax=unclassified Frankia TaxID=2632575 RepID=UPI001EF65B4B|nr:MULTISPECIES: hypothetical protein [unclassified Frankia]
MTGSPEPAGFAVVTALLCTAEEFPGELGDDYPAACAALGLETSSEGYALLLGQDASGAYWTQISTDVDSVTAALSIWAMGNEADVIVEIATVVATCPGWPVEYAISLADRPEPHDPPDAGPVLTAPSRTSWAKAIRRRAADWLAIDLADTRDPYDIEFDRLNWGDTDLEPSVRFVDLLPRAPAPDHPAVVRALREVWLLAAAAHPPPGSVRARQAAGGGRLVRAGGDGWSLVTNTAEPALALLLVDDLADMAVDISGTDGLPRLLDALTAAASRALPPGPAKLKNPIPRRPRR